MKRTLIAALGCLCLLTTVLHAQVPNLLNYQGRVAVGTVNFEGTGQFKFALVNSNGTLTYWSNSPDTSPADGVPDAAVSLTVTKGLYSVQLGDTTLANMTAVPASVFDNSDVRLRVWFNDGTNGFQPLTPDQRLTSVGFAMKAASATTALTATTVLDGAITGAKLAAGAVGSTELASNVTPKFDRQFATPALWATTSSSLVDLEGATLTTRDLGETANYLINFRTSFMTDNSSRSARFIINVNGADVAASGITLANPTANNMANASITCMAPNVAPGTVIKVRFARVGALTTLTTTETQLTIDGIPSSQVR